MKPISRELAPPSWRLGSWAVCGVGLVALVTSAAVRYAEPRSPIVVGVPAIVEVPAAAPVAVAPVAPVVDDQTPPPDEPIVVAGSCTADPRLRQPTSAADAAELRALVTDWITSDRAVPPGLAWSRGVLFVESEEDRGDDPPYPRSAAAEARRVCGTDAEWMREAVRHALDVRAGGEALTCDGNVCCHGGMEYAPVGYVAFRRIDDRWVLDAWVETYVAALGEEYVRANHRFVDRAIARLHATGCPGEPGDRVD